MKISIKASLLGIIAIPLIFVSCDGGSATDQENSLAILEQPVVRGLDINAINAQPTDTPGFPYTLAGGEYITFAPTSASNNGFLEEIPLNRFIVESSGILRQDSTNTGTIYFPVAEHSFKYFYRTPTPSESPEIVSTQTSATVSYSFEHLFERITDFIPRMSEIYNKSNDPGSLQQAITQRAANLNKVLVDAISSIGIASFENGANVVVRRLRQIDLGGITSTNADLQGPNPIIKGTYIVTDVWQIVNIADAVETPITLLYNPQTGADVFEVESVQGEFTIHLNSLTY